MVSTFSFVYAFADTHAPDFPGQSCDPTWEGHVRAQYDVIAADWDKKSKITMPFLRDCRSKLPVPKSHGNILQSIVFLCVLVMHLHVNM